MKPDVTVVSVDARSLENLDKYTYIICAESRWPYQVVFSDDHSVHCEKHF